MKYAATLIPGDGIGPEVSAAARRVLDASGVDFEWEVVEAGAAVIAAHGTPLPQYVLDSIRRTRLALKGPFTTPVGSGFRSINVALRKELDLYANVRPALSLPNVITRYDNVDLIVVRENTEDVYMGIEHMVGSDAAESIKIITRRGSERIVRFAFELAKKQGRRKVTAVHKANIMKLTDGLFLETARQVAAEYPGVEFDDVIVDACSMRLVQNPADFDVLVMPNLYGDILSDMCSGFIGGLGVAPGANIGTGAAIFEAVHGSAPTIAGQNKANPLALILSGAMMLDHIEEQAAAARVRQAVNRVLRQKSLITADLGGTAGTSEMAEAIVAHLE